MAAPESWYGKTIRQLNLRSSYGANVISVRQGDELHIPPDIDAPMDEQSALVVLASYKVIEKLKKL